LIFFIKKFHFKRVYHGAESLERAVPDGTAEQYHIYRGT
jgi:hypothetical protein